MNLPSPLGLALAECAHLRDELAKMRGERDAALEQARIHRGWAEHSGHERDDFVAEVASGQRKRRELENHLRHHCEYGLRYCESYQKENS